MAEAHGPVRDRGGLRDLHQRLPAPAERGRGHPAVQPDDGRRTPARRDGPWLVVPVADGALHARAVRGGAHVVRRAPAGAGHLVRGPGAGRLGGAAGADRVPARRGDDPGDPGEGHREPGRTRPLRRRHHGAGPGLAGHRSRPRGVPAQRARARRRCLSGRRGDLVMTTTLLECAQRTTLLEVAERRVGADGVALLTLTDPAGHDLPGWAPGAHIDLVLPEVGLIRHYSLCGDPDEGSAWRIGVLRQPAGRGGSAYVHDALRAGSLVEVRGPRNNFPLVDAERYLFVAGGIGITPILPMLKEVDARGRPWELLYGGRSRSSMAFLDELRPYGNRVRVHPRDEAGALPLPSVLGMPRPDTAVYCCGPEPLLTAVEDWCAG